MMLESVMSERMPPYFADPHIGTFKNDNALTAEQNKTLIHWLEAGAPRGSGPDVLKEQAGDAPDWPIALGKPDVIVQLPSFDVPASRHGRIPAHAGRQPVQGRHLAARHRHQAGRPHRPAPRHVEPLA